MSRPVAVSAAPTLTRLPAPSSPPRRRDIQGLRGLSVLLVVAYHAGVGPTGGFIAVDVFFVVSGFVIGELLRRELVATGRLDLRAFYLRRIRRLLPALALVSMVTVLAGALLLSPIGPGQATLGRGVSAASGLFANLYLMVSVGGYFQPVAETHPFLHTWTLSVEEQFYLVFPALLLVGWRWLRRPAVLIAVLLVVSLAAAVVLSYAWAPTVPVRGLAALGQPEFALRAAFYSPLTRAWEFFAGALLAIGAPRWRPDRRTAGVLGWGGLALLLAGLLTIRASLPFPGFLAIVPVAATVAMLAAGTGQRTAVTRLLGRRPLVWAGDLSYSWYLWHWPAIVFARVCWPGVGWVAVVAGVGSLLPATLAYYLFERPIHRGRLLPSRRATVAIAAACLVVPMVAGAALVDLAGRGWGRPDLAALQSTIAPSHADLANGCSDPAPLGAPGRPACLWTVDHPLGTVLLTGDSNAGHFSEPLIAAANALGYDVQIATTGGCPILLRPRYLPGCQHFVEGTVAAATTRSVPYAAVIVSNSVGYLNGPLIADFALDAPPGTSGPPRDRALVGWGMDLGRTVTDLRRRGPVLVVGAVPQFTNLPACLRPSLLRGPTAGCGVLPADRAAHYRDDVISTERAAVAAAGGGYLDAGGRLCGPTTGCRAYRDGVMVYRDAAHLSVAGSMLFEADFRTALTGLL